MKYHQEFLLKIVNVLMDITMIIQNLLNVKNAQKIVSPVFPFLIA